jgi:hypothetical protein
MVAAKPLKFRTFLQISFMVQQGLRRTYDPAGQCLGIARLALARPLG